LGSEEGMRMEMDESLVKEFIGKLPEISAGIPTTHLVMLACRSRLAKLTMHVKIKDLVVERKIIRPNEDWRRKFFLKVHNMEVLRTGAWYNYKDALISPTCFGQFATVIPRAVRNAVRKQFIGMIKASLDGENNYLYRLDVKAFASLHGSAYRKDFNVVTVDIDDAEIYTDVRDTLSVLNAWMITRTSRGYHVILDLSKKEDAAAFFRGNGIWHALREKYGSTVELQKDPQEPVPGTFYFAEKREGNLVRIME
jgi:hypothetical protein